MKSRLASFPARFVRRNSLVNVAAQVHQIQAGVTSQYDSLRSNSGSLPPCRFLSSTIDDNNNNNKVEEEEGEHHEDAQFDEDSYENYEDGDEYDGYDDEYDNDEDDDGYGYSSSARRQPFSKRSGSNNNHDDESSSSNRRIWLDPNLSAQDRVKRFVNRGLGELHPLDVTLASVDLIRECCKMKSFDGMKYAHDILDRIVEEKRFVNDNKHTTTPIFLSERPFKVLMYGWSNQARKLQSAPQRMREILDMMVQEAEYDEEFQAAYIPDPVDERRKVSERQNPYAGLSCQPTVDIYNTMLQGLEQASYQSLAAASHAEDVLTKMNRMYKNRKWHTKPNTKSFSLVLAAFSRTGSPKSGVRAEAVLRRMIDFHEREREAYKEEFGDDYDLFEPSNNARRIVTPDTIAYSIVIQAHAKSKEPTGAERALALLVELLESDSPSLQPDSFAFANTINAFASLAGQGKSDKARVEAAEAAENILWMMVDEYKKSGGRFEISPIPFNACIHAWVQANTSDSPSRAEAVLHKMLDPEFQATTKVSPNTDTFNACMQAWARASRIDPSAAARTEEVLNLMVEMDTMQPNVRSYATVMNAYAQSSLEDKTSQARRVLQLLTSRHGQTQGKMTAVPFTVVLNAAAYSTRLDSLIDDVGGDGFGGDVVLEDPYSVALETYSSLVDDVYMLGIGPDHMVFATMLDVVRQHTDVESIERRQRVEGIFGDARATGQVSSIVLEALFKACPSPGLLQELINTKAPPSSIRTINGFPRAWTQNVPAQFRKLRTHEMNKKGGKPRRGKGRPNKGQRAKRD